MIDRFRLSVTDIIKNNICRLTYNRAWKSLDKELRDYVLEEAITKVWGSIRTAHQKDFDSIIRKKIK